MAYIVEIQDLSFAYPNEEVRALDHINLNIEEGEFLVLCGKSGCGKSTLLTHLKTPLTPHGKRKGQLLFDGEPIDQMDNRVQTQRIGYVLIPRQAEDFDLLYAAVCGAGRALGYVCAPSLFQFVVARCGSLTSDISVYRANRDLLLDSLREMGYTCAQPDGAFYIFPRTPDPDAAAFCERAKKYDLILVSGDSFGCPGHVRISYCVPTEQIRRALPKFKALAEEYGLGHEG